jgi:hypothetical protein
MNKLFLIFVLLPSVIFAQKVFIMTDGYVTPIEFRDNLGMAPPAYSGIYEFGQPVEDENGIYNGGDGYQQKLEFLIGASNMKIIETLEVEGWEKPVVSNIDKFDFSGNKITTESFSGYFRYFKYKTNKGKIKEVECFVTTEDNFEKIFIKTE